MPNPNKRICNARRRVGWYHPPENEKDKIERLANEKAWSDKLDKAIAMQKAGISEDEILKYLEGVSND